MRIEDLSLSQLETLSKNASVEIESNRFLSKVSGVGSRFDRELEGKRLAKGLFLRLTWLPDRVCIVEHLGNACFIIRQVENSKLSVGDTFEAAVIIEGEPLYLSNLVHEGRPPVSYVAGVKSGGVHFEIIEE